MDNQYNYGVRKQVLLEKKVASGVSQTVSPTLDGTASKKDEGSQNSLVRQPRLIYLSLG